MNVLFVGDVVSPEFCTWLAGRPPGLLAEGACALVPDLTALRLRAVAGSAGRVALRLEIGGQLSLPFVSR
jgi:hypothetical protein